MRYLLDGYLFKMDIEDTLSVKQTNGLSAKSSILCLVLMLQEMNKIQSIVNRVYVLALLLKYHVTLSKVLLWVLFSCLK